MDIFYKSVVLPAIDSLCTYWPPISVRFNEYTMFLYNDNIYVAVFELSGNYNEFRRIQQEMYRQVNELSDYLTDKSDLIFDVTYQDKSKHDVDDKCILKHIPNKFYIINNYRSDIPIKCFRNFDRKGFIYSLHPTYLVIDKNEACVHLNVHSDFDSLPGHLITKKLGCYHKDYSKARWFQLTFISEFQYNKDITMLRTSTQDYIVRNHLFKYFLEQGFKFGVEYKCYAAFSCRYYRNFIAYIEIHL